MLPALPVFLFWLIGAGSGFVCTKVHEFIVRTGVLSGIPLAIYCWECLAAAKTGHHDPVHQEHVHLGHCSPARSGSSEPLGSISHTLSIISIDTFLHHWKNAEFGLLRASCRGRTCKAKYWQQNNTFENLTRTCMQGDFRI